MRIGRRRFAAPLWAWLLTFALVVLFGNLGAWQLRRAEQKAALVAAQEQAAKTPAIEFAAWLRLGKPAGELYGKAVAVAGRPLAQQQLLHDSQTLGGRAGYHVWTALNVDGVASLVLVNRGWVPAAADRSTLPAVSIAPEIVHWRGQWRPLPEPGLRTGANACDRSHWPRVVQYPRSAELECLFGRPVIPGILLLDPDQPQGFAREWNAELIPPERHLGYAFQWFALAATLLILFIVVNLRK